MKEQEKQRLFALTEIEREYWGKNGVLLAGMDEVGRGPLAGPVAAACVVMPSEPLIEYVNDSKKLSEKKRAAVYQDIITNATGYGVSFVEHSVVDEINILQATKLAFKQAFSSVDLPITDVLVDAVEGLNIRPRQRAIIHGDALSYLIAAASIIAKVERDAFMLEQHKLYPEYGFDKNKGYGTKQHIEALKQYGPCPIHRRSFIRRFCEQN